MIELEPYSEHWQRALSQARCLKVLVDKERSWLAEVQPGTVARYESMLEGAENIQRIAEHRRTLETPVEASIVRQGNTAIGIATIIHNQQVVHPEEGLFTGHDADYWLRRGESPETHEAVARTLLSRTGQTVLTAVIQEHPNPPAGLQQLMHAVGEPAQLSTGAQEDTYGVARPGQTAQLYIFPARVA
jgi:hypothetical protein